MICASEWKAVKRAFSKRFKAKGWRVAVKSENDVRAETTTMGCSIEYDPVIGEATGIVVCGNRGIRHFVVWRTRDASVALKKVEAMI